MAKDNVNHPSHYNRENSIECIDEMELVFGREATKQFCLCNVWKYRYRAADKNGAEDLKKSDWYMNKYKELCEKDKDNSKWYLTGTKPYDPGPITVPTYPLNEPYAPQIYYSVPTRTIEPNDYPPGPQSTC